MADRRFIALASKSLIRRRVLTDAGVGFRVVASSADEAAAIDSALERGETEEEIAASVAAAKALNASGSEPGEIVLGVDQLLIFNETIKRKASNAEEAIDRLLQFRGRTHALVCGAAIVIDGEVRWRHTESVEVAFRDASEDAVRGYVAARGAGLLQSVACYEIEAGGAQFIERLRGDYFSALGLPLFATLAAFRRFGALPS